MAEKKFKMAEKKPEEKKIIHEKEREVEEKLVRILSKDIPSKKKVYAGLTRIKGVSWTFSNAVCRKLGINKEKRIEELSKEEIKKIEEFIKFPDVPPFLKNRRRDIHSGEDVHLNGADLDLQKEFDIKRMKKIKSYKGKRHMEGAPVRGQRTRSHFRKERRKTGAVGVSKKGAKRK